MGVRRKTRRTPIFLRCQHFLNDGHRCVFDLKLGRLHGVGDIYRRRHLFVGDVIDVGLATKPDIFAEILLEPSVEVAPPQTKVVGAMSLLGVRADTGVEEVV